MSSVRSLPADALLELLLIASDTLSPEEMAGRFVPQVGERIGLSAAAIFLPRSDDGEGPPRLVAKWTKAEWIATPRELTALVERPNPNSVWVSGEGNEALFGLAGAGFLWARTAMTVRPLVQDARFRQVLDRLAEGLKRARVHTRAIRQLDDLTSARRLAGEAIERLGAFVDSLEGAVLVETAERKIALANEGFCQLFGVPGKPDALIGADCALAAEGSKILFRDPAGFLAGVMQRLAEGRRVVGEVLEMADGRVLERDFIPVLTEGRHAGQLWHYREVTARVLAEREISRLKQFYEQVLDSMPVQLAVFDPAGRYMHVTPSAIADEETRRWIVGRTDFDYCERRGLAREIADARLRRILEVVATRQPTRLEESFTDRAGVLRHFVRFVHPVVDAEGKVVQVLGYGLDITERKQAEAALATSRALVAAVLNASLDAIVTLTSSGEILELNPAAEKIFGLPREAIVGRPVSDFVLRESDGGVHRFALARYLRARRSSLLGRRLELAGRRHDGEIFPVELSLHELELVEGGGRFTVYLRDITERKRAERLLTEAKQAAEASARARELFLANMSHEIRTPLNGVIGMTHLLEATELSAQQRRYLGAIRFSADTLYALINDVLDFSKMEAGGLVFEEISFRLDELLRHLVEATRFAAERKGLELLLDLAPELARPVVGDPVRLKQILMNLVANAVKFTERGTVVVGALPLREVAGVLHLQFWVADTGIGIAPEKQMTVFDAFTQERSDTARRYGGTGLGLAIVKQLVEMQGGRIAVESAPGKGSVFTVFLSFLVRPEPVAVLDGETKELPAQLGGTRILLVEDNELNQLVAAEILRQEGAEVTVAGDGGEALARLASERFDLVLMDLQMPVMDGFEATRRIRQELKIPSGVLPIVALSASTLSEEKEQAYAAGMDDFVMKPFDPRHLRGRITEHLVRLGRRPGGAAVELVIGPGAEATPTVPQAVQTPADAAPSAVSAAASVDEPPPAPPVDLARLERSAMGRPALAREIVELYLAATPELIAEMTAAVAAGDPRRVQAAAHKLKSTSGVIGAGELQSRSAELEERADKWSPDELGEKVAAVARHCDAVVAALLLARSRYVAPAEPKTPPG
ncbi:MAG: PAS domain S-box protein [Holophagales bacterium]|nr:MAG: PAS domain S-box protein [Holophagales bacterium]